MTYKQVGVNYSKVTVKKLKMQIYTKHFHHFFRLFQRAATD